MRSIREHKRFVNRKLRLMIMYLDQLGEKIPSIKNTNLH